MHAKYAKRMLVSFINQIKSLMRDNVIALLFQVYSRVNEKNLNARFLLIVILRRLQWKFFLNQMVTTEICGSSYSEYHYCNDPRLESMYLNAERMLFTSVISRKHCKEKSPPPPVFVQPPYISNFPIWHSS